MIMLKFFEGLDPDLRKALLIQLRNLWTHSSTAIEGNSLTLAETAFVLEEGLTISGKPLRDHEEVVGHARAIDMAYDLVESEGRPLQREDLFLLHRAVQTEVIVDIDKPVGQWKKEPNSTVGIIEGRQTIIEYASPGDVPVLMDTWLQLYREHIDSIRPGDRVKALDAYVDLHVSFVRIHPFFDGNGRMARLVANIPVLKSGLPPVVIPREKRKEYIDALTEYHLKAGTARAGAALLPEREALKHFVSFCQESRQQTLVLVEEAHAKQKQRKAE